MSKKRNDSSDIFYEKEYIDYINSINDVDSSSYPEKVGPPSIVIKHEQFLHIGSDEHINDIELQSIKFQGSGGCLNNSNFNKLYAKQLEVKGEIIDLTGIENIISIICKESEVTVTGLAHDGDKLQNCTITFPVESQALMADIVYID